MENSFDTLAPPQRHSSGDLAQMQSLPLDLKIKMTKRRIQEWYDAFDGDVYVSFSGGKDSTVLKHIIDSMYNDVPALFVNTGLEYPEIQKFVKEVKDGKYPCFNTDVVIMRPEMRFDEVIKKYGYPVISKEISQKIHEGRVATRNGKPDNYATRQFNGTYLSRNGNTFRSVTKYKWLYESDIPISHMCCNVMKKRTAHKYERETNRRPFIGTMASESQLRKRAWVMNGCNAFNAKVPKSTPLSFWTEQDVFEYIIRFNVPYCPIYGDIVVDEKTGKRKCTGVDRTGCMFCMFGVHLEKEPNRFQRMKITHPNQYNYCMKPVSEGGLGLQGVLTKLGVPYE